MFRQDVKPLSEILQHFIRKEGLETPLLQRRVLDSWGKVTGNIVTEYTGAKFIKNQVLHVKITNPALRQDLSMMRSQLTKRLNEAVGSQVINDVRVY